MIITLFDLLKGCAPGVPESKGINKRFAVLIKLQLNTSMKDLAYRLNCSEPDFSTIFHKWLQIMYHNLRQLILWPDTETLRQNYHNLFVSTIAGSSVSSFVLRFSFSFAARAATYSNYKKHNTVKVLIAVSPTGSIAYISNAWGGRVCDKVITQECGILDHIKPGDVSLAD